MQLQESKNRDTLSIQSIKLTEDRLTLEIDQQQIQSPVIISANQILSWTISNPESLQIDDFGWFRDQQIDVLLLGTGLKQRFPSAKVFAAVGQLGIGLEVMDTMAACRTFNVLVADGRRVAAALIL